MKANLDAIGKNAKAAARSLSGASAAQKNAALAKIRETLLKNMGEILKENEKDLQNGKESGLSDALLDRLALSEKRIMEICDGIDQVISLKDPVCEVL